MYQKPIYARRENDESSIPISVEDCRKIGDLFLKVKKELNFTEIPSRSLLMTVGGEKLDLQSEFAELVWKMEEEGLGEVIMKVTSESRSDVKLEIIATSSLVLAVCTGILC